MTKIVLDSSAVLAYLFNEPGALPAEQAFGNGLISTVSLAEIITKLISRGKRFEAAREDFDELGIPVADFTRELAEDTGVLVTEGRSRGLSLGDRACLALARRERLPVMTADQAWKDLDVGVAIEVIR